MSLFGLINDSKLSGELTADSAAKGPVVIR